jgi:hypothetical protein
MARWTGEPEAGPVLEAAGEWKAKCFVESQSILSDQNLWTSANLKDLRDRFVNNPILGPDRDFLDKLREQLEPSEPAIKQLAAEVIWFLLLFPHEKRYKPETKAEQIREVWSWSSTPITKPRLLERAYLHGIGHPGTAYMTRRPDQFGFLLEVLCRWKALPPREQSDLLSIDAPWRFVAWVDAVENSDKRPIRSAFLYFLFPDYLERNLSTDHKRRIVTAFRDRIPDTLVPRGRNPPLLDLDRATAAIRQSLEKELGTTDLDFYYPPLRSRWMVDSVAARKQVAASVEGVLADYGLELRQCGSKKRLLSDTYPVDKNTGFWSNPNDATNKPLRWLVHIDLTATPPVASVPQTNGIPLHGARRIAFANTAQGTSGAVTVRVVPVLRKGEGQYVFFEQWEWLLLLAFFPPLARGSSGQLFDDFDPATGVLKYKGVDQPYLFSALVKLNTDDDEFAARVGTKDLRLTYEEATNLLVNLIHVSVATGS